MSEPFNGGEELEALDPLSTEQFDVALEACAVLHAAATIPELVDAVEEQARSLLQCENVVMLLREGEGHAERLIPASSSAEKKSYPLTKGIVGLVARDLVDYICNDPEDDPEFLPSIDGENLRNLAATPMSAREEQIGVLLARNLTERDFQELDIYWLSLIARHGALACARLRRADKGWALARNLTQFFCEVMDNLFGAFGRGERIRGLALALGREMNLTHQELFELELSAWLNQIVHLQLSHDPPSGGGGEVEDTRERIDAFMIRSTLKKMNLPAEFAHLLEALKVSQWTPNSASRKRNAFKHLVLTGRILQVAAAFEALRTARPDRKALGDSEALAALKAYAGQALDPDVVACFEQHQLHQLERRRFPRFPCDVPMRCVMLDKQTLKPVGEPIDTHTLDLGESGVGFYSSQRIPEQVLLEVSVYLPSNTLTGFVRVARQIPQDDPKGYAVGAFFIGYDAEES